MCNQSSGLPVRDAPVAKTEVLAHIGEELRKLYSDPPQERIPKELSRILRRAFQVIRAHEEPLDENFLKELMQAVSTLRRFAVSLAKDRDVAEDLVQETILRALQQHDRFERGTNLSAWLNTILRNLYFTKVRRQRREVEDADGLFANKLLSEPDQEDKITHKQLSAALEGLPLSYRQVLALVAIDGLSYEQAAVRMGCAVGTIKSRMYRARKELAGKMGLTEDDVVGWIRG